MNTKRASVAPFFRNFFPLIIIVIVATVCRFLWLDRIPVGVVHDELTYLLQVKSIALSWTDLTHTWNPLSVFLFSYPSGSVQAELPYFLFLPFVGLFPFSLFTAHATNALLGVATAVVLYLLTKELLGKEIGFIAGIIAAINPWFIYINRTAYEVTPAVFFFLLGIYVVLRSKYWNILWSFPFFILGFYSYIGTKVIFPFVIFATTWFAWKKNGKKYTKQYILLCMLSVVLILAYFLLLKFQPGQSRLGELFSFSNVAITQRVDELRKTTVVGFGGGIFDNKIIIGTTILATKLFKTFSFDYLFVYGDAFFTLWHHGLFYFIDAFFLLIGVIALFVQSKKTFLFIVILIFLGAIPQLLHGVDVNNFTPHIAFIFPWMIIVIAGGIQNTINSVKKFFFRKLIIGIIILGYVFSLGTFLHIYFFQNPIESGYFGMPDRVAARYAQTVSSNHKVIIFSHMPTQFIERYLFYSNTTSLSPEKIKQAFTKGEIQVGNITLSSCKDIDTLKTTETILMDSFCEKNNAPHRLTILQLSDGGEVYGIYNDTVCNQFSLKPYPSHITIQDLAVEKLSTQAFCEAFISSH